MPEAVASRRRAAAVSPTRDGKEAKVKASSDSSWMTMFR